MTADQVPQDRVFKSYEELERELMPKRAESRRASRRGDDLRDQWLEIMRRSIADATAERQA